MSNLKTWSASGSTTVRALPGETSRQGSGHSKRLYVGRSGTLFYRSYVKFTLNWTDVGKVLRAYLNVYTDDDGSAFETGESPKVVLRRLTAPFKEGTTGDGGWASGDWTKPTADFGSQKVVYPTLETGGLNRYDITAWVDSWAPKDVIRSDGKRNTTPKPNYGIGIYDFNQTNAAYAWAGWSKYASDASLRPTIELIYDYGLTTPSTPTNMAPSGTVGSVTAFEADFADVRPTDLLASSQVQVYPSSATNAGQTVTGTLLWAASERASNAEITNGRSSLSIDRFPYLKTKTTYKWRVRHRDSEGEWSLWTDLVSFYINNTAPGAPVLTPDDKTYAHLRNVRFRGTFSDSDGDRMGAYQVKLSPYAGGSPNWDDPSLVNWDTGKVLAAYGATGFDIPYSGAALDAGSYYWLARVWDHKGLASAWSEGYITLTADFDPVAVPGKVQAYPPAKPWRIVIRGMGTNRGPGTVVAVLENAKKIGATKLYNSPGEAHWTIESDHPQLSVIEPKQTHYAIEFYTGDGWREVFAGLVWDFDATERQVIFYGVDYLALFDTQYDERYDPANPDKTYLDGGSKYVNKTLKQVVTDQLDRAVGLTNSPVGFVDVGAIATMDEKVTVWSTMQPCLSFVTGLIESHKQGTGKKTRIKVEKVTGVYTVTVEDDPGVVRDELRLKYGELVQGYRVVPFGDAWATVQHGIGRTRAGLRVYYETRNAPGISQATWGRFARASVYDGVNDRNDLIRRVKQDAIVSGKVGKGMGLALKTGLLQPEDGYTVCDAVPVDINHGAVDTSAYGSGYWTILGVTFETGDKNEPITTLTVAPREDTSAPDTDLIPSRPISEQAEWQVGWTPPDSSGYGLPLSLDTGHFLDDGELMDSIVVYVTGRIYYDASTGQTWELGLDGVTWELKTGPPRPPTPSQVLVASRATLNDDGSAVVNLDITVDT